MQSRDAERRRKLLSSSIPFPPRGRGFLVDTGFDWLALEAADALGADRLVVVERNLVAARRLTKALPGIRVEHAPRPEPEPGDTVILPAGKQRLALFLEIRRLAERLGPEGSIHLYGSKGEGIIPAQKFLEKHCDTAPPINRAGGRILSARPRVGVDWEIDAAQASYVAESRGRRFEVAAQPGLFSWDRIDDASALMLEECSPRDGNRLLDLGCGAGVVSAALGGEGKLASMTLSDSDALALETAAETLRRNGLTGECVASDAGDTLPDRSFDLILCNPPLHQGFGSDRDTPLRMVTEAYRLLAAKGRLYLVGPPTILPGRLMEELFPGARKLAETPRFQVWVGVKRRPRRRSNEVDFSLSM